MVANQNPAKRKIKKKPNLKEIKYWFYGKKGYYTNQCRLKDNKLTNLAISKIINKKKYLLNNFKLLSGKIGKIVKLNIKIKIKILTLIN